MRLVPQKPKDKRSWKKKRMLTRPSERGAGPVIAGVTLSDSRTVKCDQPQFETASQLIVEGHKISRQTHAQATEDDMPFWIPHLRERYHAT